MRLSEIAVNENFILKALGMGKDTAKTAVGAADNAAGRVAQGAGSKSIGQGIGAKAVSGFKAGDKVNVDLRGYRNATAGFDTAKSPIFKNDTAMAKVVSITPSQSNSNVLIATLETLPGKVRQEPVYYKGQIVQWKDVADDVTRFSIPVEYLSKAV